MEGKAMAKYSKPKLEILYFDEEEITAGASDPQPIKARYSADLMNEYFFYDKGGNASQTTTVRIQNVNVTGENGSN